MSSLLFVSRNEKSSETVCKTVRGFFLEVTKFSFEFYAPVAQLDSAAPPKGQVRGSSPLLGTILYCSPNQVIPWTCSGLVNHFALPCLGKWTFPYRARQV